MALSDHRKHPLLFFIHLPKTAGTTMLEMVTKEYAETERELLYHNEKEMEEKLRLDEEGRIKCVYGHYFFGLHSHVTRPYTYATILRHPIDRLLSLYYFKQPEIQMSITAFLASDFPQVSNNMTQYLAGGSVDLGRAKENLQKHFSVIGLTERFAESVYLLKSTFGWTQIDSLWKSNVTPNRPHQEEISPEVIEIIKAQNELDLELYTFAKTLFEERIAALDAAAKKELEDFVNQTTGTVRPDDRAAPEEQA